MENSDYKFWKESQQLSKNLEHAQVLATAQTSTLEKECAQVMELYARKNKDYGDAFKMAYDEFGLVSVLIRLNDKLNRLKTLSKGKEAMVKDESIDDTLIDLASYALMAIKARRESKG